MQTLKRLGIEQLRLPAERKSMSAARPSARLLNAVRTYAPTPPPLVRPIDALHYELIEGVEVWMAVQQLGRYELDVLVCEELPVDEPVELVFANGRDPISRATNYQALLDAPGEPTTVSALARQIGLSRSGVSHTLRLLTLPSSVQANVSDGMLSQGHAKALLTAPAEQRESLAARALAQRWSIAQLIHEIGPGGSNTLAATQDLPKEKDPDVICLERRLGEQLGSQVILDPDSCQLTIAYINNDVLEGILERLLGENVSGS